MCEIERKKLQTTGSAAFFFLGKKTEFLAIPDDTLYNINNIERGKMMRKALPLLMALLWIFSGTAAMSAELDSHGFGDMYWGDSEKKVSERYALCYLEETSRGGRLAAVNFTDFKEVMGIQGPLVVLAAFHRDHLVQVNVPLSTDSEEAADQAFTEYTEKLTAMYGQPEEISEVSAFWRGKHTDIYVQKKREGILVSFIDAEEMKG